MRIAICSLRQKIHSHHAYSLYVGFIYIQQSLQTLHNIPHRYTAPTHRQVPPFPKRSVRRYRHVRAVAAIQCVDSMGMVGAIYSVLYTDGLDVYFTLPSCAVVSPGVGICLVYAIYYVTRRSRGRAAGAPSRSTWRPHRPGCWQCSCSWTPHHPWCSTCRCPRPVRAPATART